MTAQAYEILRIDGVDYDLASCPLEPWLDRRDERPWAWRTTALYRAYIGTWRIEDKALWLDEISVEDESVDSWSLCPAAIPDDLFPGYAELPVPATWFTGQLRINIGEEIIYVHHGFGSTHERRRLIRIENGRVRSDRTYDNLALVQRQLGGSAALRAHLAAQKRGGDAVRELYSGRVPPLMWFTEAGLRLLDREGG